MPTVTDDKFPCPICSKPLAVKLTKKGKPYLICDPCGVQVFVRGPAGIHELKRLLERGNRNGTLGRLEEMEKRYRLSPVERVIPGLYCRAACKARCRP
jgi:hypothetical protein